jgi:hypothetical protein
VVVALVVGGILVTTYQPLRFAGAAGGRFPGLPVGSEGRLVNSFASASGDYYVPPQRTAFTIVESLQNTGPLAVTIEAVSMLPPGSSWPLVPAGRVLYMPAYYTYKEHQWTSGRPVRGLSLSPQQGVEVGIPVRTADPCYVPNSGASLRVFYVEERFLAFTKWVAVPLGMSVVLREPEPQSDSPGLVCP